MIRGSPGCSRLSAASAISSPGWRSREIILVYRKLALLFVLLVGILITAIIHLFGRVAGHGLLRELGVLRAHEGVLIAEHIETLLEEHRLDSPEVKRLLDGAGHPWGVDVKLQLLDQDGTHGPPHDHTVKELEVRGRVCQVFGPPLLVTRVPVLSQGKVAGHLTLGGPLHPPETHSEFLAGVLEIGAVTIAGAIGLSLYLTLPLRRMSRSMDRIAAGDLGHRVRSRGADEVATMGRSFNTMADRISDMITGQKELMAGISHELRSPLTRMKVALALLRESGRHEDGIGDLESEVDNLDAMVEELLVASRLDLGSAQLEPEEIDMAELAGEAWDRVCCATHPPPLLATLHHPPLPHRVADAAEEAGIELVVEVDSDACSIHADRGLAVRLLGNLFENAVRYAGQGPVCLVAKRRDDRVEITVSDQGPGVDPKLLPRLFEPFFRADPSRSRRTGATGLGLMIVQRAVEAHGGTVRAEAVPGGGLAISFDLPA
jgi:signal transduction histidine kinase